MLSDTIIYLPSALFTPFCNHVDIGFTSTLSTVQKGGKTMIGCWQSAPKTTNLKFLSCKYWFGLVKIP